MEEYNVPNPFYYPLEPNIPNQQENAILVPPELHYPLYDYERLKTKPAEFKRVCKLTPEQFDNLLWPLIEANIVQYHPRGGAPFRLCPKTQAIVVLAYLRLGIPYSALASNFNLTGPSVRRIINEILPILYQSLAAQISWRDWINQPAHLTELDGPGFSRCVGVVDAMEQACNRPRYNQQQWYSGKSKMHTIKSQIVVEPINGRIIHVYCGLPGSTHDKTIFDNSGVEDLVRFNESIMADLGYLGIQHSVEAILPFKKSKNHPLTTDQKLFNQQVSSKRIIVEHVFSRVQKWKILSNRWEGKFNNPQRYELTFIVCCALLNLIKN